jgi:hypothetical protein
VTIDMDDSGIEDIGGIERFLKGSTGIKLHVVNRKEKYQWVAGVLRRFTYLELRKKGKTLVKKYMTRVSGFSDAQMGRLIGDQRRYGRSGLRAGARHSFARTYTKPLCGSGERLLPGSLQRIPELPSSLRLCDHDDGQARQREAGLQDAADAL